MNTMPTVLCLMGPTASGKTALAMKLADRMPVHLISVDSAMVYKRLNIGAAKPEPNLLAAYPHVLVDLCELDETYNAARFCQDALAEITKAHAAGKLPVLVGGSMLFFKAIQEGLSDMPAANTQLRKELETVFSSEGGGALKIRLAVLDPESAQRLHKNDHIRLIRAIEICETSGQTLAQVHAASNDAPQCHWINVALHIEREALHQQLELRQLAMFKAGLVDEVSALYRDPAVSRHCSAMRSVNYKQVWEYLAGECHYQSAFARSLAANRQLAKHQLTWLKQWSAITQIDAQNPEAIKQLMELLADA